MEQLNYFDKWPNVGFQNGNIYNNLLENCNKIFDYSLKNIESYPEKLKKKTLFLPIPIFNIKLGLKKNIKLNDNLNYILDLKSEEIKNNLTRIVDK